MRRNFGERKADVMARAPRIYGEPIIPVTLPQAPTPPLDPAQYMTCVVPCINPLYAQLQYDLYRWAFAQAQAVARPSLPQRDLLAVWN